jgi:hypothetical protein
MKTGGKMNMPIVVLHPGLNSSSMSKDREGFRALTGTRSLKSSVSKYINYE